MLKQLFGKAVCSVCKSEFWKTSRGQKYCSVECRKIAIKEQDRRKRERNSTQYDWVLNEETWEWKKK